MILPPPRSTLFPYTTLFRSHRLDLRRRAERDPHVVLQDLPGGRMRETFDNKGILGHGPTRADQHRHGIGDRKSTRLNSSHSSISYAVFCLKKKKKKTYRQEY